METRGRGAQLRASSSVNEQRLCVKADEIAGLPRSTRVTEAALVRERSPWISGRSRRSAGRCLQPSMVPAAATAACF